MTCLDSMARAARCLLMMIVAACDDGAPSTRASPESSLDFACDAPVVLEIQPSVEPGVDEAYLCFGFDVGLLEGRSLRGIRWTPPKAGGIVLHHASLIATAEQYPDGPQPCGAMPADAVGLHVWAPGGTPLDLGADVGLVLPQDVRRLIVEAHVLRTSDAPPQPARAELCVHTTDPPQHAAWLGVQAPVPAIRPHYRETATGSCDLDAAFEIISCWPHMHRIGKEFHGAVLRADGSRTPLIDLTTWDFDAQRTYPLSVPVIAGDAIETQCIWENPTDEYVLPGRYTSNEMCNLGILGIPAEAVHCTSIDGGP
jgi:hypothetical protein